MLAKLYQASDALVAPYRAEGFNLPVLEGLACGLPAIIISKGGPTYAFTDPTIALHVEATPVLAKERASHLDKRWTSILPRQTY